MQVFTTSQLLCSLMIGFSLHNLAQKIVNEHFQMRESPGDSSIIQGENCSHPGLRCKLLRPDSTSFIGSLPHSPSLTMSLGQVISVWVINFFPDILGKLAVFFPLGYEERKGTSCIREAKCKSMLSCYNHSCIDNTQQTLLTGKEFEVG